MSDSEIGGEPAIRAINFRVVLVHEMEKVYKKVFVRGRVYFAGQPKLTIQILYTIPMPCTGQGSTCTLPVKILS